MAGEVEDVRRDPSAVNGVSLSELVRAVRRPEAGSPQRSRGLARFEILALATARRLPHGCMVGVALAS
jgi:hypothetical protein